jgi:hypothetical protein
MKMFLLIMTMVLCLSTKSYCQDLKQWPYVNDRYLDSTIYTALNNATKNGTVSQDYTFVDLIKPIFGMEALYPTRPVEEWDYFLYHICAVEDILHYYIIDKNTFINSPYYQSLKNIDSALNILSLKIGQEVYGIDIRYYKTDKIYNKDKFISNLPRARIGVGDRMQIRYRNQEFEFIHQEKNKIYK